MRSMGTGDYICVTLRGGAPWGFTLRQGEGDTYRPFHVIQVEEGGRASLAGVRDGDEVVSLNGEPCADLTLTQAFNLIDASTDCLQLLVKRYCSIIPGDFESEGTYCGARTSPDEALESTTLHILSSKHRSQGPRELYISESQDEAYYGEVESDTEFPKGPQLLCTQLQVPRSGNAKGLQPHYLEKVEGEQRSFSPGAMVELQVSLSEQTLEDIGCTSLGTARGIEGGLSSRENAESIHTTTHSLYVPCSVRKPLGQHGVVLRSPSMLGQVEVTLQHPATSGTGTGRGILTVGGGVGGPRASGSVGSQGEEGGGHSEGAPESFAVSFGVPSEEAAPAGEWDSDSEGDQGKPNKHRARHARLRRSESLSEKQVKEAKSKCKRIALLLTAAPPNPNNKGVLMFKKHRQRAKKYTLVSYGTGENEPEYEDEEDEEDEDNKKDTHTVEFTLVATSDSELDENFFTNAQGDKGVITFNWDKGLLEIERKLNSQEEMECLPETKGKGALMFAQRRQRVDEISAQHEELRRQGIAVEGVQIAEKRMEEQSYMQGTTEGHAYMDVNMHQQSQQQQYQQYQEQQYYEQHQHYQQQHQQQYQQQKQYEQQNYQQQMYQQQQQGYQQQQQQFQQFSSNMNGIVHHQTSEVQSSINNRTAKPFSVQNMVPTPYAPAISGTNQDAVGQGEQIASRDERISTPAIKTGLLQDTRRRNTGKPMFTFKEAPKVSPNPELLNLLNKSDKKGFESGPEEDYLSLGAEACNFLQSPRVKHKTPPPVAPKPMINPNCPPWSSQIVETNQDMPQHAENSVSTPAVAPTAETTPAPELQPTPAPAPEPSPPPAPQEAPANTPSEEQHTWAVPEPQIHQQPQQVATWEENGHTNSPPQPEPAPVSSWAPAQTQTPQQSSSRSWDPAKVQPQEAAPNQSSPPPSWMSHAQPIQPQAQPQPPMNTWAPPSGQPQGQPSWGHPQEQAQSQTHVQPPWAQPQEQPQSQPQGQQSWGQPHEQTQSQTHVQPWAQPREQPQSQPQVQPPWAQPHEQPQPQQIQPPWAQPQEPMQQQSQPLWAQQSPTDSQPQPPWVQQPQQKSQTQPPWVQQVHPESQPQPPWVQQSHHQAPQQTWPQSQAQGQPQPPWVSSPQPQQQAPVNEWPQSPTQAQPQPPWVQAAQAQPPVRPQATLNPWAPVTAHAQPQPSWTQPPPEHAQHPMNSSAPQQNQAQPQPPWAQSIPSQSASQPNWQQPPPQQQTAPQPLVNAWSPAQAQPQAPVNVWTSQSPQTPANVSAAMVNVRVAQPSPKPWQPAQTAPPNRTPPPPPQRMTSYTFNRRSSSPVINPMATVLNPSSAGSAFEMPAVRGKGADLFAKRQSRMEKFIVDSETVQANKTSRSTSPTASLPNEWKYSPNALGRSYSLSPPTRAPCTSQKSASASSSPRPSARASIAVQERQTSWMERSYKPPTPWEAASRHPLGLVDEAFAFQNLQHAIASNVRLAAQRKMLPEPPVEWKARVSYQAPQKTGSQTWSQSQSRSQSRVPLPSFVSPTKSTVCAPVSPAGYRSLPRQWQPHRSMTDTNLKHPMSSSEYRKPLGKPTYKAVYTSNTTWSWKQ